MASSGRGHQLIFVLDVIPLPIHTYNQHLYLVHVRTYMLACKIFYVRKTYTYTFLDRVCGYLMLVFMERFNTHWKEWN